MFDEKFLLDSFVMSGSSIPQLENALIEMENCTTFDQKDSRDLKLLSFVESNENMIYYYMLEPENLRSGSVVNPLATPRVSLSKPKIMSKGNFAEIIDEAENVKVAVFNDGKTYFMSSAALQTMDAFGMKGSFLETPCLERDIIIAKQFGLGRKCTVVTKTIGAAKKIFAILSEKYAPVSQRIIIDILNKIESDGLMGKMVCHHWNLTHFITEVYVEFPEKAEEFQLIYGLPHCFVPGLLISTSDTGDSSLTIRGTWRLGNSFSINGEVRRKHVGKITPEKIIEDVDKGIFSEYTKLPEALCNLMTIDITPAGADLSTKKGQTLNKNAVEDVVVDVFKELGMVKAIGKKFEKSLREQMLDEFDYSIPYTAYDICQTIMSLPERISGLDKAYQKTFEKTVCGAPFASYEVSEITLI